MKGTQTLYTSFSSGQDICYNFIIVKPYEYSAAIVLLDANDYNYY